MKHDRSTQSSARRGSAVSTCLVFASLSLALIAGCPQQTTLPAELTVVAADHVIGMANAPVTVIEYADFQCPFCARFARETFPTIRAQYIDTGRVRWVFRHFPLRSIHANAQGAAEASECADNQGGFWEFHDAVYALNADLSRDGLKAIAAQLSIDIDVFNTCFDSDTQTPRVQSDVDSGTALGVSGTPTFFINGSPVNGFQSAADFSATLERALNPE